MIADTTYPVTAVLLLEPLPGHLRCYSSCHCRYHNTEQPDLDTRFSRSGPVEKVATTKIYLRTRPCVRGCCSWADVEDRLQSARLRGVVLDKCLRSTLALQARPTRLPAARTPASPPLPSADLRTSFDKSFMWGNLICVLSLDCGSVNNVKTNAQPKQSYWTSDWTHAVSRLVPRFWQHLGKPTQCCRSIDSHIARQASYDTRSSLDCAAMRVSCNALRLSDSTSYRLSFPLRYG